MIEQLQSFIVTSWHGHRNDPNIPQAVWEVWRGKFKGRRDPRQQSNVDLAILDSQGRVVHSFDGFPKRRFGRFRSRGRRETLGEYTARELKRAASRLGLTEPSSKKRSPKLPDLEGTGGIRLFVRLMDDRMKAYQAPVVEVVPLEADDWKPLAYCDKERFVDATTLKKWLSLVYPPGVMERTNPHTKQVYKIDAVEGVLSLAPAGSDGELRYAVLHGEVRLTDEGLDEFSYKGTLEIVLSYRPSESKVHSLRGVFEGIYPRVDRMHQKTRKLPLLAAFESRPE